jgi:hypothetical protein
VKRAQLSQADGELALDALIVHTLERCLRVARRILKTGDPLDRRMLEHELESLGRQRRSLGVSP